MKIIKNITSKFEFFYLKFSISFGSRLVRNHWRTVNVFSSFYRNYIRTSKKKTVHILMNYWKHMYLIIINHMIEPDIAQISYLFSITFLGTHDGCKKLRRKGCLIGSNNFYTENSQLSVGLSKRLTIVSITTKYVFFFFF